MAFTIPTSHAALPRVAWHLFRIGQLEQFLWGDTISIHYIAHPTFHGCQHSVRMLQDYKDGSSSQVTSSTLDNKWREDFERMKKARLHRCDFSLLLVLDSVSHRVLWQWVSTAREALATLVAGLSQCELSVSAVRRPLRTAVFC
jgi:hypothetical protein